MADVRDRNIDSALNNLERVKNSRAGVSYPKLMVYTIGSAIALAGVLGVGNAASKLSVRAEHEEEDKCGFTSSDVIELLQSVLFLIAGILMCIHFAK